MRRSSAFVLGAVLLAGCGGPTDAMPPVYRGSPPVYSASPGPAEPGLSAPPTTEGDAMTKLGGRGEALLKRARADGATEVVLMISTTRGAAKGIASTVRDLGGEVQSFDVPLDFLRVSVPTDRVESVAALPTVSKVDLEEPATNWDPTP